MKFGPFEFKIRLFQTPVKKELKEELGQTGTTIFGGYITGEDYITELQGVNALTTYDKMRKSDGVVKAALMACELPIRAANWYIEPASDDEKDKEVSDFVSESLFEKMTITWDDFLRQALLMLPFGFSVFEKVFQMVIFRGKQMIGWRKFAPRLQKTIQKWQTESGEDGIVQSSQTGSYLNISIPISKLLIFTHQKEGDNWLGISVLRSAYRPWFFKGHMEKINAITFEKQGMGIPYAKIPQNATEADKDRMEKLLKNIRANEQGYMMFPEGWEVGFVDMKAGTLKSSDEDIRRYNREILISVLAQFLDLGSGPTGSRALSADHSSTFHNNLVAVAKTIQDIINKYAIKQLVDLNYTVEKYPILKYSYIGLPRYLDVANALSLLIPQGAVMPDEKLEDYLRQLMNLPKKTVVEIKEEVVEKPKQEELKEEKIKKASEFVGWRKLTFAERKVNFADIRKKMDEASERLRIELDKVLSKSSNELIRQFEMVLEAPTSTEKRERLNKIDVKYQGEYRKLLYNSILEMFQYGKMMAAHEMKKEPPSTPANSLQLMSKLADGLTQVMSDDLIKEGKLALLVGLQKKQFNFSETLNRIMRGIRDVAKSITMNASLINVSSAVSQGRRAAFSAYGNDIYALQRSEILDDVTCNYCLSIDSRIFRKNDGFTRVDSIHSNCRGLWVEIMKEEAEKPPITGMPLSLREVFDTVNVFEPPKHPIVKKNSPAAEFLKEHSEISIEKEYEEVRKEKMSENEKNILEIKNEIEKTIKGL